MASKHVERFSTSLVTREMQVKITVRYHFISITMARTKKAINIDEKKNIDEDMEKSKPLYIAGGNVKWCRHLGKPFGSSSKN